MVSRLKHVNIRIDSGLPRRSFPPTTVPQLLSSTVLEIQMQAISHKNHRGLCIGHTDTALLVCIP